MKLLKVSILLSLTFLVFSNEKAEAVNPFKESFSGRRLDTSFWFLKADKGAKLVQSDGHLNYTSKSSGELGAYVSYLNNNPKYNENWEMLCTVVNRSSKFSWVGFIVMNTADTGDRAGLELIGNGSKRVVQGEYSTNDSDASGLAKSADKVQVYLRVRFDKITKTLTYSYRTSKSKRWTTHLTFSTNNSAASTRRGDWKMTHKSEFYIVLYGGSFCHDLRSDIFG
jgi:hypothetical protein